MFARITMPAVVALVLGVGGQAKATPLSYGTYYDEEFMSGSCTGTFNCRSDFSATPSDNLVLLKKINCQIISSQPVTNLQVAISQTPGGAGFGRGIYVNPGPAVVVGGPFYEYSFQTDAQILIGQGRYPFIEAAYASSGSATLTCGILGDLVTPIQ